MAWKLALAWVFFCPLGNAQVSCVSFQEDTSAWERTARASPGSTAGECGGADHRQVGPRAATSVSGHWERGWGFHSAGGTGRGGAQAEVGAQHLGEAPTSKHRPDPLHPGVRALQSHLCHYGESVCLPSLEKRIF